MKALMYFFVMAVIVIAGCAQDDTMFENQEALELKKAKVPIPFKAVGLAVPDKESALVLIEGLDPENPKSYAYSRLYTSGTASHMGKIDSEKSFYTLERLVFYFENGVPYTKNTGKGILVGANGDGVEYTFTVVQNALDFSFSGENEIIPGTGTGKLKGCTGTIYNTGELDPVKREFIAKMEGYIVFE
jgi:hypothetical protein